MGFVKKSTFNQVNMTFEQKATQLKNWFDQFGSSLISTTIGQTSLVITVDNKIDLHIDMNADITSRWNIYKFGFAPTGQTPSQFYELSTDVTVSTQAIIKFTICISNSLIYLCVDSERMDYPHYGFIYEKIGTTSYYGQSYFKSSGVQTTTLTQVSVKEHTSQLVFNHSKMFNYAASVGAIDYANIDALFSGTEKVNDTNFVGCTTVTPFLVYTINGKNYYAVSANSLFPMDALET